MKNSYVGYYFWSTLCKIAGDFYFGGKVIGKENIPLDGSCILAGNHTGNYDAYLLFKGCKRPIHIISKKELFEGKFKWLFKTMHLIPVDRKRKNPKAKQTALKILNEGKVLGIFPEGTYHKTDIILPFKPGVISFASKTNAPIIPFAITGKFKFQGHPTIKFGKPIFINEINENKLAYLENIIKNMLLK